MKRLFFSTTLLLSITFLFAQKKPLDHSVYDSWQHIGERKISNDGKWVVYTIDPQQGDNELVIQSSDAAYKMSVPRGYSATITEDSRFVVFKIRPFFKDTREAKIKKKKGDDMPKDSFAIVELGKENVWKTERVKSYKTPEKESGWVAYHLEKSNAKKEAGNSKKSDAGGIKITDSLKHVIDSLYNVIESMPQKKKKNKDEEMETDAIENSLFSRDVVNADGDDAPAGPVDAGTDLIVRNLIAGKEKTIGNVLEYYFSKKGEKLLVEQARNPKDSLSVHKIVLFDLKNDKSAVLSTAGNDFKNFSMTEDGSQVAYVAERDAKPKELQKFYKLWYYKTGMDSAMLLVDKNSVGMQLGMTISEFGNLSFSKSENRLFFGTAPIQPPKDTTLVDFENAKLDIWHYNDDYLQPVQLSRLQRDLRENFLAVYFLEDNTLQQLETIEIPTVYQTNEGDGVQFVGVTDFGKRIESQWMGGTKKDIYAINVIDGSKKLVKQNLQGFISSQMISPTGKYIMWYDSKAKNYFTWDGTSTKNITAKIKYPVWDEEHDSPSDPPPYGLMGWHEGDSAVYVYDKYDVWKISLPDFGKASTITAGRKDNEIYRYLRTDPEEKFISFLKPKWLKAKNEFNKNENLAMLGFNNNKKFELLNFRKQKYMMSAPVLSKESAVMILTKESYTESPDLYSSNSKNNTIGGDYNFTTKLSSINPQQENYNWGTVELFNWKAYNGKQATGLVYKPENFDSKKKYPTIVYFYEKLSDNLYDYKEPAPIRAAINVPFFVSRGYIVFMPDIEYTTGHPGKNAYDYIVSGARALVKKGWADSTNMALQGHSWGGYQAAQVATMTKLFKAIWSGAPVANMTSAYGGIRWGSGMNRQFQYEKTQSRIGGTLWDKLPLYMENSPLFHLPKVTAPMVILHNDGDGAVPWYQGIELFTGLRRLGKKVWLLNYNGQDHGLSQRQDMRDYQIRMQQFFDWILKGEKPAKWIIEGVPAVKKGKDWGLELVD